MEFALLVVRLASLLDCDVCLRDCCLTNSAQVYEAAARGVVGGVGAGIPAGCVRVPHVFAVHAVSDEVRGNRERGHGPVDADERAGTRCGQCELCLLRDLHVLVVITLGWYVFVGMMRWRHCVKCLEQCHHGNLQQCAVSTLLAVILAN